MNVIEITNLTKYYRKKRVGRFAAVNDLTLAIAAGEIFGFLGPNGAGKSTTIKVIMGLIPPSSGTIAICGKTSSDASSRSKVGYLPENPAFYDFLSAREYLAFVGRTFGMATSRIKEGSDRVFDLLELTDSADRAIRTYSKGMVQRVGIAQTLLHDPDVFILDEPMSGLDPLGRGLVKDIIVDLKRQGKTVFFSTHITSDVETICDRVGILQQGELRLVERVEKILESGIIGYNVRCSADNGVRQKDIFVAAKDLGSTIASLEASGETIIMIEPVRRSLEELFIDMVRGRPHAAND